MDRKTRILTELAGLVLTAWALDAMTQGALHRQALTGCRWVLLRCRRPLEWGALLLDAMAGAVGTISDAEKFTKEEL